MEVCAAQTLRFRGKFMKQKLQSTPDLLGAGQVKLGPGPHPGVRLPVQVKGTGLLQWSLGRWSRNLAGVLLPWGPGR